MCYKEEKPTDIKKPWKWNNISYNILNIQLNVTFPYMFFLYNHDQIYMKDLSKPDLKGYYYMNNYLGIDKGYRPLTVFGYIAHYGKI